MGIKGGVTSGFEAQTGSETPLPQTQPTTLHLPRQSILHNNSSQCQGGFKSTPGQEERKILNLHQTLGW